MPTTYKVLGQVKPTAATATTLYTVPASTQTVVSSLLVSNLTNDPTTINLAVRVAGATLEDKHYIAYNNNLGGYSTRVYTLGITLGATDVLSVYDTTGKASFSLFGSEIS
jgi:hypothetical protein